MQSTSVHRLSGCLVALGYCLLIPSICAIVVTLLVVTLGVGSSGALTAVTWGLAQSNAVHRLQTDHSIPQSYVDLFKTNQDEAALQITNLPVESQPLVREVFSDYTAQKAGMAVGTGGVAFVGTIFIVGVFVVCIPLFIVGFLLILKKKVWRCRNCGYIFERA